MFPLFIGKDYSKIMPSPPPGMKQLQLYRIEHYYHQGRPQSPQTVDTSLLKVKMVEKRNLSQICCKWTIPAKLTHVTLLPLMSPDDITLCWNSVDSKKWREKNESVEPRIILQKKGITMRPFLHMSAFQLANHNLEMCKYHHGYPLTQDSVPRCEVSTLPTDLCK